MSAPLRFLALAVIGWAGLRAATLGMLPGAQVFPVARAEPAPPPVIPTVFPPLEPVAVYQQQMQPGDYGPAGYPLPSYPAAPYRVIQMLPYHWSAAGMSAPRMAASASAATGLLPEPGPHFYSPVPQLDDWPISRIASTAHGQRRGPAATAPLARLVSQKHLDRLQLSTWAHWRGEGNAPGLASGGILGGSQAGARLSYALDPRLALSLRSSSPIGSTTTGGEIAAGLRVRPLRDLPLAITAERRQAIGHFGGRSAFALFVEGGLYSRPLPLDFSLDAYAQAGIVGFDSRDLFADGGATAMRSLYGPVSLGFGAWGGIQPGLHRIDAGPRLSLRVKRNMRIDLDWRQRLSGGAQPGSGPAVTLSADF